MELLPVLAFLLRCAPGAFLGYALGGVGGGIILGIGSFILSVWLTSKWEESTWSELAGNVPFVISLAVWGGVFLFGLAALISAR